VRVTFYNADNNRPNRVMAREARGVVKHLTGLVETPGYDLPRIKGHRLIHEKSNPSRGNVALYFDTDLFNYKSHRYVDMEVRWPRVQGPGMHPPRSFLHAELEDKDGDLDVFVVHAPQLAFGTALARRLWEKRLVALIKACKGRVIVLGDFNGLGRKVARRAGIRMVGNKRTDLMLVRGFRVIKSGYKARFRNDRLPKKKRRWIPLRSNHKEAMWALMETAK
jgi:hypothetical protein